MLDVLIINKLNKYSLNNTNILNILKNIHMNNDNKYNDNKKYIDNNDNKHIINKNNDYFIPNKEDKLFWCLDIIMNGYSNYHIRNFQKSLY